MALHARELARCATAALARQLQVCARLSQASPCIQPVSVVPIRGVNSSSHGRNVGNPRARDAKNRQAVNRASVERIRIKLPATATTPRPLAAITEAQHRGPRKPSNQSTKGNTGSASGHLESKRTPGLLRDLINKQAGLTAVSDVAASKDGKQSSGATQGSPQTTSVKQGFRNTDKNLEDQEELQAHRKEVMKSKKSKPGKFHKKRNENRVKGEASITEPMYTLSRDINQWFNEVMRHLARAEREAAASAAQKSSGSAKKQQRLSKPSHAGESAKNSKTSPGDSKENAHSPVKIGQTNGSKLVGDNMNKQFAKGDKPESSVLGRLSSLNTQTGTAVNKTVPGNAEKDLKYQVTALNEELSSNDLSVNKEGTHVPGLGASSFQSGSPSNAGTKMMEIRPSLVENSEKNGASLASSAAWLPYGALHDTISEKSADLSQANRSESRSKVGAPTPGPGAAAAAPNGLPGPSRYQLVLPGSLATTTTTVVSKQNSWEKGKGFILLNNKDKEKEAQERQTWLKKTPDVTTPSGSGGTGFILVDSEKPSDGSSSRSASNKNVLLSDNPHVAAAKRANDKEKMKKQAETGTALSTTSNRNDGENTERSQVAGKGKGAPSPVSTKKAVSRDFPTVDLEVSRWAELVQRKLIEIQRAKVAASEHARRNKSQSREGIRTGGVGNIPVKSETRDRTKKATSGDMNIGGTAPQGIGIGKRDNVPEIKKRPPPCGKQDPDLDKTRGSVSDPKPSEASDVEYERRIGQFIDSSMGYEDAGDPSKIRKIFGPLTRDQHRLLEKARRADNFEHLGKPKTHPYLQSKDQLRPVPVHELKPDLRPAPKTEKAEKYSSKKSEPTLYVKPEEIATMKKIAPAASPEPTRTSNTSGSSDRNSKPLDWNSSVHRGGNQSIESTFLYEQSELWLSMSHMHNKVDPCPTVSESSFKEGRKKPEKATSSSQAECSGACTRGKPCSGSEAETAEKQIKGRAEPERVTVRAKSYSHLSGVEPNSNQTPVSFQHEFIKLQQEKLDRSRLEKSAPNMMGQTKAEEATTPNSLSTNTKPFKPNGGTGRKQGESLAVQTSPKPSDAASQSSARGSDMTTSKAELSSKEGKPRKGTKTDTAQSSHLDAFESWVQSMEDWKWKSGVADKSPSGLGAVSKAVEGPVGRSGVGEGINAKQPTEAKQTKKEKYPRFEQAARPDIAGELYRDMRVTYGGPRQDVSGPVSESRKPFRLNTISQSDQIYNMIKDNVQPRSGMPLMNLTAPLGRKSKVLTQAGLGPVISNSTGLVDPSRIPKLGNLFNSFDGFLAMDAVPVLDAQSRKSSKTDAVTPKPDSPSVKTAKSSSVSGDGVAESDLRHSLAREREAASSAARRRLIAEYEKNIEKYERGLELYRTRLRRVRQALAEQGPHARNSDNPRRHSDL